MNYQDTTAADLERLVIDVARAHRLTPEEVWDARHPGGFPDRAESTAARGHNARRVVYLTLRLLGWSSPQIGAAMDRDHTTVLYHLRQATPANQREAEELATKWTRKAAA